MLCSKSGVKIYPTLVIQGLNFVISNISGHWLKIKKLLKKYGKTAVNLHFSARRNRDNAFDCEIPLSALSRLRFLMKSIATLLQFYYRISLITFYF